MKYMYKSLYYSDQLAFQPNKESAETNWTEFMFLPSVFILGIDSSRKTDGGTNWC